MVLGLVGADLAKASLEGVDVFEQAHVRGYPCWGR